MAQRFGKLPSEVIGLSDSVAAVSFNYACSIRLQIHENKEKREFAKLMSLAFLSARVGEVLEFEGENNVSDEENEKFLNSIPTHIGLDKKLNPNYAEEMKRQGVEVM